MTNTRLVLMIAVMVSILPAGGCRKRHSKAPAGPPATAPGTETVEEPASSPPVPTQPSVDQAATAAERLDRWKEELSEKVREQVSDIQAELPQLEARANEAGQKVKARYDVLRAELEVQRKAAEKKLAEARAASEDRWQEAKVQAEQALDKLREAWNEAVEELERESERE